MNNLRDIVEFEYESEEEECDDYFNINEIFNDIELYLMKDNKQEQFTINTKDNDLNDLLLIIHSKYPHFIPSRFYCYTNKIIFE